MLLEPEKMEFAIGDENFREEGSDGLMTGVLLVEVRGGHDLNVPAPQVG